MLSVESPSQQNHPKCLKVRWQPPNALSWITHWQKEVTSHNALSRITWKFKIQNWKKKQPADYTGWHPGSQQNHSKFQRVKVKRFACWQQGLTFHISANSKMFQRVKVKRFVSWRHSHQKRSCEIWHCTMWLSIEISNITSFEKKRPSFLSILIQV